VTGARPVTCAPTLDRQVRTRSSPASSSPLTVLTLEPMLHGRVFFVIRSPEGRSQNDPSRSSAINSAPTLCTYLLTFRHGRTASSPEPFAIVMARRAAPRPRDAAPRPRNAIDAEDSHHTLVTQSERLATARSSDARSSIDHTDRDGQRIDRQCLLHRLQ
jgi:hypothetical protein